MLRRTLSLARSAAASASASASVRTTRLTSSRALSTIIHKSPHPELDIPNKTIFDIVGEQLPEFGKRDAVICGVSHETMTFEEMYESSKRVAVALANDGVKKGDVRIRFTAMQEEPSGRVHSMFCCHR
jgi:4-coumarate--CoA ligase